MTEHYGRYRDDYDDEYDDYEDDAADYGDEGDAAEDHGAAEDDTGLSWEGSVRDDRLLTGAVDEAVSEGLDDPTVNESAAYQRIRRMKGSRRWRARARRQSNWIPPDLRGYGPPVFWPVEEPSEPGLTEPAQGPAPRLPIDPSNVERHVGRLAFMAPLMSCSEMARARGLDVGVVTEAARALQQQGELRKIAFGCLMPPADRYYDALVNSDTTPWEPYERSIVSYHSQDGLGSLLRYSMPRIESINQVAVQYVGDGWTLEGIAWVERDAVQAVALYNWRGSPEFCTVSFVWVGQWDTEREIWERLTDLPEAVGRITPPGIAGSVALIGADRWAVARALPMAVESLRASQIEPADIAAWTHAEGWQAASGTSMLDGAAQPFTPTLAPAQLARFVWPSSRRSLGRTKLETIINSCPWTRRDARTLCRTLNLVAEHPGASIAHYGALAGETDSGVITRKRINTLVDQGLVREAGPAGVTNVGTPERPEVLSARGRGQMRYRLSLGPKGEGEPAQKGVGESREEYNRRMANGAHRVMLDHGELSFREIVRRSGTGKLQDRFGDRLVHEDVLVDILGRLTVMGCEVVATSRARTVNAEGWGIDPDGMLYCNSPAGTGYHYVELELSHLGPRDIRSRIIKYAQRLTSYPLAVVCRTDLGARHYDRIGQEMGVPVVATSIPRLKKMGLSTSAWFHQGQEAFVTPVTCPPRPSTGPGSLPAV